MKKQMMKSSRLVLRDAAAYLTALLTAVLAAEAAAPEGRGIALSQEGTVFRLHWNDIADAPYHVQTRTNLARGAWGPLATVIGTGAGALYTIPEDPSPSRFFRVLFPQPVVKAGEPARYASGAGGSYLYITGDYFYSGDQVRVGGILANNAVLITPSLLRVELPPGLPPGRHDIEILGPPLGAILASLHEAVTVIDLSADPYGLLQGPPEPPLALPMALWASKRGYDYYKAASDNAASGLQTNPYFVSSGLSGSMPLITAWLSKKGYDYYKARSDLLASGLQTNPYFVSGGFSGSMPLIAAWLSKKGYDYYQAQSQRAAADRQEGKKGINAVNVKLARLSSGANGNDSSIGSEVMEYMVEDFRYAISHKRARAPGASDPTVIPFSGEVQQQVVDLAVEGRGIDFIWARTYHSRIGRTGPATNGWTFSYALDLQPLGGDMIIHNGTGRADRYVLQSNGTYTCPEFFGEGTLTGGVFRLTFADTGYWEFKPLGTAPEAGKLDRIVDRNGNAVSMNYDTAGRLSGIVDTLGRAYTVAYDTQGRLASVTDYSGRTVSYEYDGNGDLAACISPAVTGTPNGNDFPNGKTNRYAYTSGSTVAAENHLLTACVDGLGETTTQFGYDLDPASASYLRCTSFQRGAHAPAQFTYQPLKPSPDLQLATLRCIVNDPLGHVTETLWDARGRGIEKRDIKRRAIPGEAVTDTSSLPIDKLRPEDPDFTVTRWRWNNDSLCTSEIAPGGQNVRCTYQGDLDPSTRARKRADCRVVKEIASSPVDTDGDGVPDATERVSTYEYDPRFGSEPNARQGGNHMCPQCPHPLFTDLAATDDKYLHQHGFKVEITGFATTTTDPGGNVTQAEYDPNGNCTRSIKQGHYAVSNFQVEVNRSFNSFGQLTAVTNPPDASGYRRVDTLSYYGAGPQTGYLQTYAIDEPGTHRTTTFEYDARGNVTRVVDPRENDVLITYNALNQPVTVPKQTQGTTFGERVKATFFYDANDNLVRIDRDNRAPDGAFDPVNPQWTTTFEYDSLKRVTQVAHELAQTASTQSVMTNRFVYDGNDQCVQVLGSDAVSGVDAHHAVTFAYDTCGLLYRKVAAPGSALQSTSQYDYDANGLLIRVSEGLEEGLSITTLAYDGFAGDSSPMQRVYKKMMGAPKIGEATARLSQITDPMGNISTFHHDVNDNLLVARHFGQLIDVPGSDGNIRLAESRYAYDGLDRCTVQRYLHFTLAVPQSPVGDGEGTTSFSYAPNGQLVAVTNDLGATTVYTYDRIGLLASVTDPRGNQTSYSYDPCGNVLSVTRSDLSDVTAGQQRFTQTFTYDTLNRHITATDNVGNTVSNAYDACDNVVGTTDPSGNETVCRYDGLGRVIDTTHYAGAKERGITINTSHVEYRNNRLVSTTDANTNTTSYAYDSCDRLTLVTHADSTVESLIWSPRSNLQRKTDANGTTVTNSYDLCNRLIHRDIAAGAGVQGATTFETFAYDGLGRLAAAENNASTLVYTYDSLGNRVTSSQNGLVSTATFDGAGNRRTCTCPSGSKVHASFDALNRPAAVSLQVSAKTEPVTLATFAYDGPDRLAKITRANTINTRVFWDGVQGTPNSGGDYGWLQVARINHARAGGGQVVDQRTSLYDRNQNKVVRGMTAPWVSGGSLVTNLYSYDALNRLNRSRKSGSVVAGDFDYVYDGNGNRLQVTNNGIVEAYAMDPTMPEPADFQMNQYTDTPFGSELHDAQGNRVGSRNSARSTDYRYDYANRLVQVDELDPIGTPVTVATYSYDPLGRRIGKTVFPGGLPPVTTAYVYDDNKDDDCDGLPDDDVLEVYKNAAVSSVSVLAGGSGGGAAAASYAATGRMLSPPVACLNGAGEVVYTHCDELGNLLALTDAAGNVIEHYDYSDFGAPLFFTAAGLPQGTSSVNNDVLLGGTHWDEETGFYYCKGTNPLYSENNTAGNNPFYESASCSGGGTHYDPLSGKSLSRAKGTVKFFNETKGFGRIGGGGGTRVQDHNSSRSNKSSSLAAPDWGGGDNDVFNAVRLFNPIAMDKGLRF